MRCISFVLFSVLIYNIGATEPSNENKNLTEAFQTRKIGGCSCTINKDPKNNSTICNVSKELAEHEPDYVSQFEGFCKTLNFSALSNGSRKEEPLIDITTPSSEASTETNSMMPEGPTNDNSDPVEPVPTIEVGGCSCPKINESTRNLTQNCTVSKKFAEDYSEDIVKQFASFCNKIPVPTPFDTLKNLIVCQNNTETCFAELKLNVRPLLELCACSDKQIVPNVVQCNIHHQNFSKLGPQLLDRLDSSCETMGKIITQYGKLKPKPKPKTPSKVMNYFDQMYKKIAKGIVSAVHDISKAQASQQNNVTTRNGLNTSQGNSSNKGIEITTKKSVTVNPNKPTHRVTKTTPVSITEPPKPSSATTTKTEAPIHPSPVVNPSEKPPTKEAEGYSIGTIVGWAIFAFVLGTIVVVAAKISYTRYRRRTYVVRPQP